MQRQPIIASPTRRSGRTARYVFVVITIGSLLASTGLATEITDVQWLEEGFILVSFDDFPAWNGWTMVVDGKTMSMEGAPGEVIVRPNDAPHRATGVFIGTDPWVTSLENVDFPCEGTLRFYIPGEGFTNTFEFSLRDKGCCTAADCADGADALVEWDKDVFNPQEESGIPYDPPVVALISIGPVNALGEATFTGAPGAAFPNGVVYLVNLASTHQAHTLAAADGSFEVELFAPPGSPVMIKHGPRAGEQAHRWRDLEVGVAEGVNPFPGTIVHVPYETGTLGSGTPFATAASIDAFADDSGASTNIVASAWSLEGTMSGPESDDRPALLSLQRDATYAPGDWIHVTGTLRIHSQAITAATNVDAIRVHSGVFFLGLFDARGAPIAARDNFMSTTLTPTGLPIQGGQRPTVGAWDPSIDVRDLRFVEAGLIEGRYDARFRIPANLPSGVYRPVLWIEPVNVPRGQEWVAAYVVRNTYYPREGALPPIEVGSVSSDKRLIWRLMTDDFVLGTRGAGAKEDADLFGLSSQIVTQGAPFVVPPTDERTGLPIEYRLEPFLPMISFTDRRMPTPPLIPFDLPGGELRVSILRPDGTVVDLGASRLTQSFNRTKTTRAGRDLNEGTVQLEDVYSLMVDREAYRVTFEQYGHHVITMTGWVEDVWGNRYEGGGTYDVWVAHPLDIDPGTLPGTPMEIGDAWNPMITVHPNVPVDVEYAVTQIPESDPDRTTVAAIRGTANDHGTFAPTDDPIVAIDHGEYRVDLVAHYTDPAGELYMGAMTWGGVVMTPSNEAMLIAHGRRGLDSLEYIPNHWFVAERDLDIGPGQVPHALNPYYNGDILWSRDAENSDGGASLVFGASVQDPIGLIEAIVRDRAERQHVGLYPPGGLQERFANGEIPLFISTVSGLPDTLFPDDVDQIAYSYTYSERPGIRVREVVSQDEESGGYWRLNTLYDDQPGVGILGDQPNDFKFQYVGTVYRDLVSGHIEYGGQGTGWVFIPPYDPLGNRVMPPFAGEGNGGWTTEGGPIMTLAGEDVDIFIHPTGVRPGSILEVGERVRFSGHIMPTLDSTVEATITSPSGRELLVDGQANRIGYFYDPADDIVVDEAGVWTVDVHVWHGGTCSGGATVPPYPSGDVLGSDDGRFVFYVVPADAPRLTVTAPESGFVRIPSNRIPTIAIRGIAPGTVHYTITMPGVILDQGTLSADDGTFALSFDPIRLHDRFPNLDLIGRDDHRPGLSDTFSIALFAEGDDGTYAASVVTIQGERIYAGLPNDLAHTPELGIAADDPSSMAMGRPFVREVAVRHSGWSDGSPVGGIVLSDAASDAVRLIERTGGDDDDLLEAGETWLYEVGYPAVEGAETLITDLVVRGVDSDGDPIEARWAKTISFESKPSLVIAVEAPLEARVGETVTYRFLVEHADDSNGAPVSAIEFDEAVVGDAVLVDRAGDDDGLLESGERWTFQIEHAVTLDDPDILGGLARIHGVDPAGDPVDAFTAYATNVIRPTLPDLAAWTLRLDEGFDRGTVDSSVRPSAEHFAGQYALEEYAGASALIATCNCFFGAAGRWTDFAFETRFTELNAKLTVSYRLVEATRYYVEFETRRDLVHLGKELPSGRSRLQSASFDFEFGEWVDVVIVGRGAEIQVFIDGEAYFVFVDPSPIPRGGVGFETQDQDPKLVVDFMRVWEAP